MILLCLLALVGTAAGQLRRGRAKRRAVLIIAPTVPCPSLEGMFRAAVEGLLPDYRQVAVYGVLEGERARLAARLAAGYRLTMLTRAEALRLWRGAGADFWRLAPDGGCKRLR